MHYLCCHSRSNRKAAAPSSITHLFLVMDISEVVSVKWSLEGRWDLGRIQNMIEPQLFIIVLILF